MLLKSRFATKEEIFCDEFTAINKHLFQIHKNFNLTNLTEINDQRFPWSKGLFEIPSFYVSRMWEYPFAILSADLQKGMKCADIGCGTSPFIFHLSEITGRNCVTGFDPDEIKEWNRHANFGTNAALLNENGINFKCNYMDKLDAPDESFDRVFCISVLEHIDEDAIWQKGIREMVRILKPGGRLIITIDIGMHDPVTKITPLDIIRHSGISICGDLNYLWPQERFLKVNTSSMDVFGLILEKNVQPIYAEVEKQTQLPQFDANGKFVPDITDPKPIKIADDLKRSNGTLRVIAKTILGKYKN